MPPSTTVLPHEDSEIFFLTDGGMETTLVFLEGWDLPHFASCELVRQDKGREWLLEYYRKYASLAQPGMGFVLEAASWRANPDWCDKLGYSKQEFKDVNVQAVELISQVAAEYPELHMVKSGSIGPRRDGYAPTEQMSAEEAQEYHQAQIQILKDAGVDVVSGFTLNYINEAVGITRAAKKVGVPVVVSFTVETDGSLPTGETLKEAIEQVDAASEGGPDYYMINCAHHTHFVPSLQEGNKDDAWISRIRGVRCNASKCSHAELDDAEELDDGNPEEFGQEHLDMLKIVPKVNVLGGCCGTDHRHVEQICKACAPVYQRRE